MARRDRSSSRRGEPGPGRGGKPRGGGGRKPPRGSDPQRDAARGGPPRAGRDAAPREEAAPEVSGPPANVVYGRNAVREALRGRRRVKRIWVTAAAAKEGFEGTVVEADEITARVGTDAHQGVCAEVSPYPYADAAELLAAADPFIVALDEVTDPQNLGAVIRTAECAGVTGVVIPERRSAEVTGAVAKASAGAVEHLPVARVRNLADFLGEAKEAGCWTYGAAAGARTRYDGPDYTGGVVLVLGAEGRGLRPRVAGACDELVSLPLLGRIDSLNVSAAGAVLMYAILQKRLDAST
ncbi:MAG TPA: 23S rRNA (guanosine(2251)-2'-O)-methyltransferase RlmB [Solirubrobacteraceae bacterium]|nr:23S rRNA (guanosine(2251)-2'-O)-methyltransferase RlmB [Solirubrobacteraceae bacterium]